MKMQIQLLYKQNRITIKKTMRKVVFEKYEQEDKLKEKY